MAKKLALINMKGGVGKSTIAVNIAWDFAVRRNLRVLLVDLDPQFNASQYMVGAGRIESLIQTNHPTTWEIFEQLTSVPGREQSGLINPRDALVNVRRTTGHSARIDLIPSRLELSHSLRSPAGNKEQLLDRTLSQIESDYDVIVLDCAPTESILTIAAYIVCDWILVPVRPEYLSTIGLPLLAESLRDFDARYPGQSPEIAGIVFNALTDYSPEEVTSKQQVKDLARRNNWYVFQEEVSYSRSFPKGAREGSPIFSTSYVRTRVSLNFAYFTNELVRRIGL